MRDIRFRAWDKDKKMMIMDIHKEYDTITGVRYWKNDKPTGEEPGEACFDDYLTDEKYEVMQFTGLTDKHGKGKEAYIGDIVQDEQGQVFEIKWEASYKNSDKLSYT